MPIPRYQPGTGNLGPAQPIMDEMGGAYNKGVDFVENPMEGLRGMLGMQSPHQQAVDQMNRDINSHRNDPANQSFQPVVAPPRRKPVGKM